MSSNPGWISQNVSRLRSEHGAPPMQNSERLQELAWNSFAAYINSGKNPLYSNLLTDELYLLTFVTFIVTVTLSTRS